MKKTIQTKAAARPPIPQPQPPRPPRPVAKVSRRPDAQAVAAAAYAASAVHAAILDRVTALVPGTLTNSPGNPDWYKFVRTGETREHIFKISAPANATPGQITMLADEIILTIKREPGQPAKVHRTFQQPKPPTISTPEEEEATLLRREATEGRAPTSTKTGPGIATAPNSEDARTSSGALSPTDTTPGAAAGPEHDTATASRAAKTVPGQAGGAEAIQGKEEK